MLLNVPSGSSLAKMSETAKKEGVTKRPQTSRPGVASEQPAAQLLIEDVLLECVEGIKSIREQTEKITAPLVRYGTKSSRNLKTQYMYQT